MQYKNYDTDKLRYTFNKVKDKSNWRNPITTFVTGKERADRVVTSIAFMQGDKAKIDQLGFTSVGKRMPIYRIKSKGFTQNWVGRT